MSKKGRKTKVDDFYARFHTQSALQIISKKDRSRKQVIWGAEMFDQARH